MPVRLQRIDTFYQLESSFIDSFIPSTNMNKKMNMTTLGSAQSSIDERTCDFRTTFKRFGVTVNAELQGLGLSTKAALETESMLEPDTQSTGRLVAGQLWTQDGEL